MAQNYRMKGKYLAFVLMIVFLAIGEVNGIRFGKKSTQTNKQVTTQDHTDSSQTAQLKQQKTNQHQVQKATAEQPKGQSQEKTQKPLQIKPQITSPPVSISASQQAIPSPKKSSEQLGQLFGTGKQTKKSAKQGAQAKKQPQKGLTITPQKSKSSIGSSETARTQEIPVTQASPTTQATSSQTNKKSELLDGLFEQKKSKATTAEIQQTPKPNAQQTKATTKLQAQPFKPSQVPKAFEKVTDIQKLEQKNQFDSSKNIEQLNEPKKDQIAQKQQQKPLQKQTDQNIKKSGQKTQPLKPKQQQSEKDDEKSSKKLRKDSDEQQTEQQSSKSAKKQSLRKKQVQDESQFQNYYPSSKSRSSKSHSKASPEPQSEQDKSKYSLSLLFTALIYGIIIVCVVITLKCTSTSTKAAKAVNIMVDAVGDLFKKKQGYRPALNEEQVNQRQDQVTVGYKVDDNKQIFWEKNSVQGI